MGQKDPVGANRRKVLSSIAALGSLGTITVAPVSADEDWNEEHRDEGEYPKGPVTVTHSRQAENQITYDEYREVLEGPNNGDVRLSDGRVKNERIYVGDDRNVTVNEIEKRFSSIRSDADSGTWEVDCRTLPLIGTEVCTEITFDVYTWGIEVDLIIYGYPLWGGGVEFADGAATPKFNIPGVPVKGEATIGARQLGGCDAELEVEIELEVLNRRSVGPFGGTRDVDYC
ncbi:hypothetical protein JCM17823_08340 [Halorubrum gandharaense]